MVKRLQLWWKRWTTWEFLPAWLANMPVYGFYGWFAARARHLFFFSNVNPAIPLGGALGESKFAILDLLPSEVRPVSLFVPAHRSFEAVEAGLQRSGLKYPIIAKPDVGERGFLVRKIDSREALQQHLALFPVPFILQEFLNMPLELSLLFHRFPESGKVQITSICLKEFLHVRGDGRRTVAELMADDVRAGQQLKRFRHEHADLLAHVPADGESLLLEPIGNHCRGTKFLDGNDLLDATLQDSINRICSRLKGIHYGRFDLKCDSLDALRRGDFKVMELNGVLGEPAHVYDPRVGMWRAYGEFYRHWRLLYQLHRAQSQQGVHPTPHREGIRLVQNYFRYKKQFQNPRAV